MLEKRIYFEGKKSFKKINKKTIFKKTTKKSCVFWKIEGNKLDLVD